MFPEIDQFISKSPEECIPRFPLNITSLSGVISFFYHNEYFVQKEKTDISLIFLRGKSKKMST